MVGQSVYCAAMFPPLQPLQLLLVIFAGWVNRRQLDVIEYLEEENRMLKERVGGRRIRLTDAERCRLARKAHALGRKVLNELHTLVTPDTLLRWYREMVACKCNYSHRRGPGRPRVMQTIVNLVLRMALDDRGGTHGSKDQWPIWDTRSGAARSPAFSENTGSILPLSEISTCRGRRFFGRIAIAGHFKSHSLGAGPPHRALHWVPGRRNPSPSTIDSGSSSPEPATAMASSILRILSSVAFAGRKT